MKTNSDKATYTSPFVMALGGILRPHQGTSLVKVRFLQAKAPRSRQDAVSFNVIQEKCDLVVGPPATGLLDAFGCGGGDKIMGSGR